MGRSLREVAEGILTGKQEQLSEAKIGAPAIPQMPMQSVDKDEADRDEQGEEDLGARIDTNRGKPTSGPSTAGKSLKRAPKRPADGEINNEPMHTIPDPDEDSDGPMKFPKRPADVASNQWPMQSLESPENDKQKSGKGPNITENKKLKPRAVKEDEADIEANDKKVQAGIKYEEVDLDEDMEALFNGEQLSEEFKEKAKTIFEAAVNIRVAKIEEQLQEAYEDTLNEQLESIQVELAENVDDYLNYVVESWVLDNEVAIEAGLRTELTEDFISGLRNLFLENYIDVPEEKIQVIDEMLEQNQELEEKLNEQIEQNVQLKKQVNENLKEALFVSMTKDLPDTHVAKLRDLTEGLEFVDENTFIEKVSTIYENYYPTKRGVKPTLEDKGETNSRIIAEDGNDLMEKYTRALSKTAIV